MSTLGDYPGGHPCAERRVRTFTKSRWLMSSPYSPRGGATRSRGELPKNVEVRGDVRSEMGRAPGGELYHQGQSITRVQISWRERWACSVSSVRGARAPARSRSCWSAGSAKSVSRRNVASPSIQSGSQLVARTRSRAVNASTRSCSLLSMTSNTTWRSSRSLPISADAAATSIHLASGHRGSVIPIHPNLAPGSSSRKDRDALVPRDLQRARRSHGLDLPRQPCDCGRRTPPASPRTTRPRTEEPIDFRSLRDSHATWLALAGTPDK